MKALIFGSSGQDGHYLTRLLESRKIKVIGVSRSKAEVIGSVADRNLVERLVLDNKPDYIFHLAAVSVTHHDAVWTNHQAISIGTLNVLEACKVHSPRTRIFLSGSALQLRNIGEPISEDAGFVGDSSYAVHRIHSFYLGKYYREQFGLKVSFGYFFNHDSPLRDAKHVNQKIIFYLRDLQEKETSEKLRLGPIDVKKEFNFAGDLVEAAWLVVNQDVFYDVVLGCGKAYSIRDWLTYCFASIGEKWTDHVEWDANGRTYDILISQPGRLRSLGWNPKVSFEGLADMMLGAPKN